MDFFVGFLGVIFGGVITWLVARYYYERASGELKNEASELRRYTVMILLGLEEVGLIRLIRGRNGELLMNEEGNIRGIVRPSLTPTGVGIRE